VGIRPSQLAKMTEASFWPAFAGLGVLVAGYFVAIALAILRDRTGHAESKDIELGHLERHWFPWRVPPVSDAGSDDGKVGDNDDGARRASPPDAETTRAQEG
jgi:hypothetical protein